MAQNPVDVQLQAAVETNADPAVVSPSRTWFAWRPVFGWDYRRRYHRFIWLERVIWFRPLGLLNEYFTYAGSEEELHDKHGRGGVRMPKYLRIGLAIVLPALGCFVFTFGLARLFPPVEHSPVWVATVATVCVFVVRGAVVWERVRKGRLI